MSEKRFHWSDVRGRVFEGVQYVNVADVLNEFHDRLTALERGGEKLEYGKGSTVSADDMRGILAPKPAPATVERFTVWANYSYMDDKYEDWSQNEGSRAVRQKPIGEVVATRDNNGWWRLCYEPNKWTCVYSQEQYEWIVDHLTSAGIWERKDA